jgi:uncharacterized protein YecT (DUF1311 family)
MLAASINSAFFVAITLAPAQPATPQEVPTAYVECMKKARTQTAITVCAGDEAKRVETHVAERYAALVALSTRDPVALQKVRNMQSAWIAFRDAYIEAMFPAPDKQAEYGSSYSSEVSRFRTKLAQGYLSAIEDIIDQYTPK